MPKHLGLRMKAAIRSVCLVLLVFCGFACMQSAFADEGEDTSRAIAVAYDNSGSMITDSDKWCGAKYSIEVFASMLGENDSLSLYTMDSSGEKLSLLGSQDAEKRVNAVHDADLGVSDYTDPRAAKEAYEALLASDADEKYLVVTTDGAFNVGGGLSDINAIVSDCREKEITVIYLAIGDGAETIEPDESNGVYVKRASASSILSQMTEVANQVFGRDALPATALDTNKGTLSLEVPMGKVIVFAQGEDVSVGSMTSEDGTVVSGESVSVSYCTSPSADMKYGTGIVDKSLKGVVVAFSGEMPKGDYSLNVEGATTVEVYYEPYVNITIGLTGEGGIAYDLVPDGENELSAGTYDVQYNLCDPFSGEVLESSLLEPSIFGLVCEQDDTSVALVEGEQLEVATGEASLTATAQTSGGVKVKQQYQGINVSPAVRILSINANGVASDMAIAEFGGASYQVLVEKEDGTAFSEAEWETLEFEVTDEEGVDWLAQKDEQIGTIRVSPQYDEGGAWDTQKRLCGRLGLSAKGSTLSFKASATGDQQVYYGSAEKGVSYWPDTASAVLRALPFLLLLLLLLFLLFKWITKPRLPRKIKPYLTIGSTDEHIALRYNEKSITNKISPFGPERVVFDAHAPKDSQQTSGLRLASRFELGRIGLVACKKKGGKRCFVYDEETNSAMRRHIDAAQADDARFPDPDYSPKPAKNVKDQSPRGIGSTITFYGWNVPPKGKKRQEETYTIRFKNPQ